MMIPEDRFTLTVLDLHTSPRPPTAEDFITMNSTQNPNTPRSKHTAGAPNDCYSRALEQEPLFTFLGRDRHAAALVELWAFMREKEGESQDVVVTAREAAAEMRAHAVSLGRPALTFDSVVTLAASLVHERAAERDEKARSAAQVPLPEEGDLVTARGKFSGHVGSVMKVFAQDAEPPSLRGQMNVRFGKHPYERLLTVARASFRKTTDEEARGA